MFLQVKTVYNLLYRNPCLVPWRWPGKQFLAAYRPSKWHILSYATKTFDQLAGFKLFRITKSHGNTMIKTWEELSDLKKKRKM